MAIPEWSSINIPADKPSPARIYDYFLGGVHYFPIDKLAAETALQYDPTLRDAAQANRAFLRRAVKFLCDQGIDQFLDIGSGMPTAEHVHSVALRSNPSARVVYVDIDPVAVMHSQAILHIEQAPDTIAIQGDLHDAEGILAQPDVRELFDFARPIGVILAAVMHYITDDTVAARSASTLRDALAPGSYLAMSHATFDPVTPEYREQLEAFLAKSTTPARMRSGAQIAQFFDGLELVEPGLVYTPRWRSDGPDELWYNEPEKSMVFAGVGRKP
jgi:hypothetical protein